jgi:hypothetical protein
LCLLLLLKRLSNLKFSFKPSLNWFDKTPVWGTIAFSEY